jgi:hypothetical protein
MAGRSRNHARTTKVKSIALIELVAVHVIVVRGEFAIERAGRDAGGTFSAAIEIYCRKLSQVYLVEGDAAPSDRT